MTLVRVLLLLLLPTALAAQQPTKVRPFSLLSRAAGFNPTYSPNRTACALTATGFSEHSTSLQTCGWPGNSSNTFLFSAGLQVAGIIGADGDAWAGDTTGVFFFDLKGTTEHGAALTPVYVSNDEKDRKAWPADANIPSGPGSWFRPEIQGAIAASNVDAWSMAWDGDARLRNGRRNPLGIAIETRLLGWNYPRGNDDIQYVLYTIYNITSSDPATYNSQRPEMRDRLSRLGRQFHANVDNVLGQQIPAAGYTLASWFAAFAADPDVGDAGSNHLGANVPLATFFTYDGRLSRPSWWRFDAQDFSAPFFAGAGFFGVTVLQAPDGSNSAQIISSLSGGQFGFESARDVIQLYRYLSGTLHPASGDPACNTGNPLDTHLCYINNIALRDERGVISVRGDELAPGASATFAVALTFAAPYGRTPPTNAVPPGNPLRLSDPVALATGANPIDSIGGFLGYVDRNGDGVVQGAEFTTAPRSMMHKSQLARTLFESRFLLPTPPVAPDFFLVPGDNTVSVLWKPSVTETAGDPFFASAAAPTTIDGNLNPLYDPNFRQFDVEGYRVYRSRTRDFREATLVAQFDYAGTSIRDYTGRVNPSQSCAPEFGIRESCPTLDSLIPGHAPGAYVEHPLAYRLIQLREGDRYAANSIAYPIVADTLGADDPLHCLCDTGVPFLFVDRTVRNGVPYYYTVTAFDVNSLQSAPSSMESAPQMKPVRPVRPASNVVSEGQASVTFEGRGKPLSPADNVPVLDLNGRFSGPFPPANGWRAEILNFVPQLFQGSQEARIRLDSIELGQTDLSACCAGGQTGIPVRYHFTVTTPEGTSALVAPLQTVYNSVSVASPGTARIGLYSTDPALTGAYGGTTDHLQLSFGLRFPASADAFDWGMSSLNGSLSSRFLNGARWFDGPSPQRNEVMANPNGGNCNGPSTNCYNTTTFNNAGALSGVVTVYQPMAYVMMDREWRNMGESQLGARRAADYNLYWGTNGTIDSVIDVTHNVPVPFSSSAGGTWGVLNTSAQGSGGFDNRTGVLTPTDWTCVEPFRSRLTQPTFMFFPCSSPAPFMLSQRAELGAVAFGAGNNQAATGVHSVRNPGNLSNEPGFALYLAGTITHFGLNVLPPPGTIWALRDYTGIIFGSAAGSLFYGGGSPRPLTAVGTELVIRSTATNTIATVQDRDLRQVHTVPDPFYYDAAQIEGRGVKFVNLPTTATIRIYTASGVLIRLLDHQPASQQGDTYWDLKTRNGQQVASGVYFYHIESRDARKVGRMTVVNYTN